MVKLVQRLRVKADMLNEYKKRHDEVWSEMSELMHDCGIHNYTIWSFGGDLFAYCEIDDLKTYEALLRESEIKQKWDEFMSDIIISVDSNAQLMFEFN